MKMTAMDIARSAWGSSIPDWVEALAQACVLTSQAKVARELDRSTAIISQVLNRVYKADTARIEERVRGRFMDGTVTCPALGTLATDRCQDWREKAGDYAYSSPLRTRMFRACHGCPRFVKKEIEEC